MKCFKIISSKQSQISALPLTTRILHTHDGFMTKLLSTITNSQIHVQLLGQLSFKNNKTTLAPIQVVNSIERIVFLKNKQSKLALGRSFWNTDAYERIIKNKAQGIGANMMKNKVQYFRQINWNGVASIQLDEIDYTNLEARSYKMFNQKQLVCQIQEYFLPQLFKYF